MNVKRLWMGRIAVMALLLSLLLSIPVLADAGLTAWQGRKIESGVAYEQYQWALREMEYEIQNAFANPNLGGKPISIQIRPGNADVFQQYLNALEQMEHDIQNAVPNE